MSRYAAMFAARGEGAFGAFVMLGDPDLETSAAILDALVAGGADMLEVGIPFSDPIADGPVIQAAAERALGAGVDARPIASPCSAPSAPGIRTCRSASSPMPISCSRGAATLSTGAPPRPGVDSVLVADVPVLEAEPYAAAARAHGVAPVLIAAANTPAATASADRARSAAATPIASPAPA